MFVGVAPCLKRGGIQIAIVLIAQESIQALQRTSRGIETTSQSLLQIDIPSEDGCQARRKLRRENRTAACHHFFSFRRCGPPGTARDTSRKSPVANRRYMDVLSAVRCPRMSPMVLRGVPFFR